GMVEPTGAVASSPRDSMSRPRSVTDASAPRAELVPHQWRALATSPIPSSIVGEQHPGGCWVSTHQILELDQCDKSLRQLIIRSLVRGHEDALGGAASSSTECAKLSTSAGARGPGITSAMLSAQSLAAPPPTLATIARGG